MSVHTNLLFRRLNGNIRLKSVFAFVIPFAYFQSHDKHYFAMFSSFFTASIPSVLHEERHDSRICLAVNTAENKEIPFTIISSYIIENKSGRGNFYEWKLKSKQVSPFNLVVHV